LGFLRQGAAEPRPRNVIQPPEKTELITPINDVRVILPTACFDLVIITGTIVTEIHWAVYSAGSPQDLHFCGEIPGSGPCVSANPINVKANHPNLMATFLVSKKGTVIRENDDANDGGRSSGAFRLLNGQGVSPTFHGELLLLPTGGSGPRRLELSAIHFSARIIWENNLPVRAIYEDFQGVCK